jgi:Holliday junction resolvase RusA-like endonuclease
MNRIVIQVHGEAKPQGSKKGFYNKKLGRVQMVESSAKLPAWRSQVTNTARQQYAGPLLDQPLKMTLIIDRVRPKSHFNTKGMLNANGRAYPYPTAKPDLSKLLRAIEDSLTKVIYRDDSLIVEHSLVKRWGDSAKTTIIVEAAKQPTQY